MKTPEIAIIGMACRFPMANSVDEFWQNLCQKKECLTRFSEEELIAAGLSMTEIRNTQYVPVKGILSDIDQFDAGFFQMSPADASITDPQQRLFMECAWEALENAAIIPNKQTNTIISAFTGIAESTYLHQNLLKNQEFCKKYDWFQSRVAAGSGTLSTQLSYRFNLHGASITLNTACSTGLVAVISACQELLSGRSDVALAGSVSIQLPQIRGYLPKKDGIESLDGYCRPFDHRANGTVFSNGVGVVVLKRLTDAIADRDTVYAVIRGYGINNDGANKLNYFAPGVNGQAACIQMALAHAGISADEIGLLEAHGTATALGDFIEMAALNKVYRQFTNKNQYCALSSVKSNIGHTDVAAGIASLIKTALCLYHKKIPATLHFEKPNPQIRYEDSPFYINSQLMEWTSVTNQPYAGVSAFGVGGTNSHVILSSYSPPPPSSDSKLDTYRDHLIILSAKSELSLQKSISNLHEYLRQEEKNISPIDLSNLAYTLQTGRDDFKWRSIAVGNQTQEITVALNVCHPVPCPIEKPIIIFMFPGQGSQYFRMAHQLYQQAPLFKSIIDQCSEIIKTYQNLDICDLLFNEQSEYDLNNTAHLQPALFTVEYALSQLLMSYSLKPSALIGHSIGEYVAACLAGIFSLSDALYLVCQRGQVMEKTELGSMLAISCNLEEFSHYQKLFSIDLAAHNAEDQCVASGEKTAIAMLAQYLEQQGKTHQFLKAHHAFHSQLMRSVYQDFYNAVSKIQLSSPQLPILSNLTGDWLTAGEAIDPYYWCQHLISTVKFKESLDILLTQENPFFIEVGPGQTLSHFVQQAANKLEKRIGIIPTLSNSKQDKSDLQQLLKTIGAAWQYGAKIDWLLLYNEKLYRHITLPTYSFDRKRYWIEPDKIFSKTEKEIVSTQFFSPTWLRSTINKISPEAVSQYTWIIFKDELDLGNSIISYLKMNHINPIVIESGDRYEKINPLYYQINPAIKSNYIDLWVDLKNEGFINPLILHLFSCNLSNRGLLKKEQIDYQLSRGFYSLLYLTQSYLEALGSSQSIKCAVVTECSQQVLGDDDIRPINATLSGICRIITHEHPKFKFQLIDINLDKDKNNLQILSSEIVNHCTQKWQEHPIIAFRNRFKWQLDYVNTELGQAKNRFKDHGVYIITGGLGGISLALCEKIAEISSGPIFVLLSRSVLNSQEKIKKLQSLGATVLVKQVDISDSKALKTVVMEASKTYGYINGVIHNAGIPGGGLIQLKTEKLAQATLLPKVYGTYYLAEALQGLFLDFVVLSSSLGALVGMPGQIDYCAANACLDAFANSNLFSSSFNISINWNTWKEQGMAVKSNLSKHVFFLNLGNDITTQQGKELFAQIMKNDYSQIAISNYDLAVFDHIISQKTIKSSTNYNHLTNLNMNQTSSMQVSELWKNILGVENIGIEEDFFNIGGNSLIALELLTKINENFHCSLTLKDIYAARTVIKLSTLIEEQRLTKSKETMYKESIK